MDDGFIFEIKIESVYKKPALVRISDNASNINIENIVADGAMNGVIVEGDAMNINIDSMRLKNCDNPFVADNIKNSSIRNITIDNSKIFNSKKSAMLSNIKSAKTDEEKAGLIIDYAMFLKINNYYEDAFEASKKALNLFKKSKSDFGLAICYGNIGVLLKILGHRAGALKCHNYSMEINRKIGNTEGIIGNLMNIGILHDLESQSEKSYQAYQEAFTISKQSHPEKLGTIYFNIGILYEEKDLDKALEYYFLSIGSHKKYNQNYEIACALRHLGKIYKKLDITEATKYIKSALEIFEVLGNVKEAQRTKQLFSVDFY